jgi:hypothetical protein
LASWDIRHLPTPVPQDVGVKVLTVRRPFHWGLLLATDRDAQRVPELSEGPVSTTADGLAIGVLHAADVDLTGYREDEEVPPALVTVEVILGGAAPSGSTFNGTLRLDSGLLSIGDADEEEVIETGVGTWRVAVICQPHDFPDHVTIWLWR